MACLCWAFQVACNLYADDNFQFGLLVLMKLLLLLHSLAALATTDVLCFISPTILACFLSACGPGACMKVALLHLMIQHRVA